MYHKIFKSIKTVRNIFISLSLISRFFTIIVVENMKESKYIWLDGKFVPWSEAKIHVLTHALHYGTGVFEGIRAYETVSGKTAIFRGKDHVKRLLHSSKIYRMDIGYTSDQILEIIKETVKINELKECYIRPLVFRGYKQLGVDPTEVPVSFMVAAWEWGAYLGKSALENGIKLKTSTWRRIPPQSLPLEAKATGQYLNSALAKIEAKEVGFDEALMLDYRGVVSEGTGENIFIVRDDEILTPPLYSSVLPGITRKTVIKLATDLGYKVTESEITLADVYMADEVFLTGTAAEITPVINVDGIIIGSGRPGEITRKLQAIYFDVVRGKRKEYEMWLDYI
jgi:branched-chain amino acid aminotransferase